MKVRFPKLSPPIKIHLSSLEISSDWLPLRFSCPWLHSSLLYQSSSTTTSVHGTNLSSSRVCFRWRTFLPATLVQRSLLLLPLTVSLSGSKSSPPLSSCSSELSSSSLSPCSSSSWSEELVSDAENFSSYASMSSPMYATLGFLPCVSRS